MSSIEKELDKPDTDDISSNMYDPESTSPWYIVIRAVENFREKFQRYPGATNDEMESDFITLREEALKEKEKFAIDESVVLDDRFIREMVRFSDS